MEKWSDGNDLNGRRAPWTWPGEERGGVLAEHGTSAVLGTAGRLLVQGHFR